ncbi:Uncharacterized protein HDE_08084 [Halotydeus destructor]|nr:Uncharacterized protein HDE_08084 [Halotydeus destructor]
MFSFLISELAASESKSNDVNQEADNVVPILRTFPFLPRVHASSPKMGELYDKYKDQFILEKEGETGAKRVKDCWKNMLDGNSELNLIVETGGLGACLGFMYGATIQSRGAVADFIRRHNEMTFEGDYFARRKLHDFVFRNACTNGAKTCWRAGIFPAMFASGVVTSFAYRNYVNPLDFAAIGGAIGAIWKFKLGPRGMLTGACVSAFFGLFAGVLTAGSFWITGTSVAEYRYWKSMRMARTSEEMSKQKRIYYYEHEKVMEEERALMDHDVNRELVKEKLENSKREISAGSKPVASSVELNAVTAEVKPTETKS